MSAELLDKLKNPDGFYYHDQRPGTALAEDAQRFRAMIDALPAAIYTTDANGKITHFNPACIEFSGRTPQLGSDYWCVSWKLFHPDGRPMPHDQCPMAIALKERRIIRGIEGIAERPDGTRVCFMPHPTPLFDDAGELIGGINMLVDITERKAAEARTQSDADALTKLNQLSSRLWNTQSLSEGLDEMLAATIDLLRADFGNIQILDASRGVLLIEAQQGFQKEFLDFFREVSANDGSACGRSLRSGERIVVEDVEADLDFAPMIQILRNAGFRAVQSTPIIARDGRPLGMISTHFRSVHRPLENDLRLLDLYARQAADFIEHKRAEKILRESDERQRQVLALMPAAVYCCDARGLITYFNERAAQLWGRTPQIGDPDERFCGSDRLILTDGTELPHEQCPMALALREGKSFRDAEVNIRQPNGTMVPVMVNIDPIRDEHGNVIGAINAFYDLSAIKQAEQAQRESEQRFRMLADNMAQLAWICDKLGNVTWYNQRWLEYTGMSFEEMKAWGWTKCHHPDHVDRVIESITHAGEMGEVWEDTFPLRSRDGSYRWFLSRALPIRDTNGEITAWFGTNTDIEDLKQAREAAETANQVKEEFLATVSHELRTPLNAIMGWTQLLTRGNLGEEAFARGLDTIARNAAAQSQLISDLLDVSRIVSGKLRCENGVVDLVSTVAAAIDTVRPAADSKGIALQLKLDKDLGLVSGDAMRLQQVVWNLLINAIKFTPRGGLVTVRLSREGTNVLLTVSDTGEGISAEFFPYVFDRFRQAENTAKRQHGGMGLGLAIARYLVEAHGGTIHASSKGVGRGSTFVVTFPLLAVPSEAATDRESASFSEAAAGALSEILEGLRVLVVDDNEDVRELSNIALTQGGAEVRTADTARAALEVLKDWKPNILVADIGMPGEDGYDLIRAVRALEFDTGGTIPALALTGYASAIDVGRVRAAGYHTHMAKPVSPRDLVLAVANLAKEGVLRANAVVPKPAPYA